VKSERYGIRIDIGNYVEGLDGTNYGTFAPTANAGGVSQIYSNGDADHACGFSDTFYRGRGSVVQFQCGFNRDIIDVEEDSSGCNILVKFQMPACCTSSELDKLHALHQMIGGVSTQTVTGGESIQTVTVGASTQTTNGGDSTHTMTGGASTQTTTGGESTNYNLVEAIPYAEVNVSVPVDMTSSPELSVPVGITSSPYVTVNLHMDTDEHSGDRDRLNSSSANAAIIIILIIMPIFCIFLIVGIYQAAGTPREANGCNTSEGDNACNSKTNKDNTGKSKNNEDDADNSKDGGLRFEI